MYDAVQERIAAYEQEIVRKLGEMEQDQQRGQTAPRLPNTNKAKMIKKRGQEAKRQALYRMSGVDSAQIDASGVETVEVVLSEYGCDGSRFPTKKHFVSHITLTEVRHGTVSFSFFEPQQNGNRHVCNVAGENHDVV